MPLLPSGTISLLFTDIENFTRLCAENGAEARAALGRLDALLRRVVAACGGVVFGTDGDAMRAAFPFPREALAAAVEVQTLLRSERNKSDRHLLQVRMALHIGAPERRDDDYFGPSINTITWLRNLGHGDQILTSHAFYEMVHALTGSEVTFRNLQAGPIKGMPHAETVFQIVAPGLPEEFPPLRAVPEPAGSLPLFELPFCGRARSLKQIGAQIEQHKLLTLRGTSGIGKTRLGVEASRPLTAGFPGGVWLVRVDGLENPSQIARETVRVLNLVQPPGLTAEGALIAHFREHPTLILLDNCDYSLKGSAEFARNMLAGGCPDLRLLATSREPLGVPGEFVREVPPLPLPRGVGKPSLIALQASEAVQLFTIRAAACSEFAVSRQNAAAVNNICRALGGIPLALELAASAVGMIPLEDIAQKLTERGDDSNGDADSDDSDLAAAQERTVQATIDWAIQSLNAAERAFLFPLAVFAGGFTREAAFAVSEEAAGGSGHISDLINRLVERSLIICNADAVPEPRFYLPKSVREMITEQLAGRDAEQSARNRHRDWFLDYASLAEPELQGSHAALWWARLEADQGNLRAALKWTSDPAVHRRLTGILHHIADHDVLADGKHLGLIEV